MIYNPTQSFLSALVFCFVFMIVDSQYIGAIGRHGRHAIHGKKTISPGQKAQFQHSSTGTNNGVEHKIITNNTFGNNCTTKNYGKEFLRSKRTAVLNDYLFGVSKFPENDSFRELNFHRILLDGVKPRSHWLADDKS